MNQASKHHRGIPALLALSISLLIAASFAQAQSRGESGEVIRQQYPELATLFNAFDVTQAALFDEVSGIIEDRGTRNIREALDVHFRMLRNMSMSEMMQSEHGGHNMNMNMNMAMSMDAPYGERESAARGRLLEIMRGEHNDDAADEAFAASDSLSRRAAEVLRRGRAFENRLFAIYADDDIRDKQAAVVQAVAEYLDDERDSVAAAPKDPEYLLGHAQGTGFQTSFPRLSGFLWSQQWLQLAALEAVILQHLDANQSGGVDIALQRFWNKIGSDGGMTMFPVPVELPMAPAIAPNLYSQSAEAAFILDNLNILETMIADALSYPQLDRRQRRIDELVAEFTSKQDNIAEPMDYLLFSLRGGIYNQGGPAVGELSGSERNRSRAMMNMRHSMIMSTP